MAYVVVLDDHGSHGEILSERLAESGCGACLIRDVSLGITTVDIVHPDLVVIDAPEAASAVRKRAKSLSRMAPVILISNSIDETVEDFLSGKRHPFCAVNVSTSIEVALELVEALLVPVPEVELH